MTEVMPQTLTTIDTRPHQPAFPRDHRYDGHNGMTLRDYFAAKVIAMLVVHGTGKSVQGDARIAYTVADAMLEERTATPTQSSEGQ